MAAQAKRQVYAKCGSGLEQGHRAFRSLHNSTSPARTAMIDAWLQVRRENFVMRRDITSGGRNASGGPGWIHFG